MKCDDFEYLLVDTNKYDNKDFQQLDVDELKYSILTMKYIFHMDEFFDNLADILANIDQFIETEQGGKFFQTMVFYLYKYSELTADQWREKMHAISPQLERKFVSTYDQAIAEGIEKGILQGIEKGILQGMEKGLLKGRKEGISQGKKQAIFDTAKKLKNMGIEDHIISESTGLSLAEIKKL